MTADSDSLSNQPSFTVHLLSNRETPSELRAISEVLSPAIRSMTVFPNLPLCITFSVLVAEVLISADLEDCLDAVLRIALRSIQFRVQDV